MTFQYKKSEKFKKLCEMKNAHTGMKSFSHEKLLRARAHGEYLNLVCRIFLCVSINNLTIIVVRLGHVGTSVNVSLRLGAVEYNT